MLASSRLAPCSPHPGTAARLLVGPQYRQGRHHRLGPDRHRPTRRGDGAVAPAALHRRPRLRHLRLVPHGADRLAGTVVPRADGLRRVGCTVRRSARHRWCPLLDSGPDSDLRFCPARSRHRDRVTAGARAVSRRGDVRLRPDGAAVFLFPPLLHRRVPRWRERALHPGEIVVPQFRRSTDLLLRGPRRPGARPLRAEPLP